MGIFKKMRKLCCITYDEDDESYMPYAKKTVNDDDDFDIEPLVYKYKKDRIIKWVNAVDSSFEPDEQPEYIGNEDFLADSDTEWDIDDLKKPETQKRILDQIFGPESEPIPIPNDWHAKTHFRLDWPHYKNYPFFRNCRCKPPSSGGTTYYPSVTTCTYSDDDTTDDEAQEKCQQLEEINKDLRTLSQKHDQLFQLYKEYKKQRKQRKQKE